MEKSTEEKKAPICDRDGNFDVLDENGTVAYTTEMACVNEDDSCEANIVPASLSEHSRSLLLSTLNAFHVVETAISYVFTHKKNPSVTATVVNTGQGACRMIVFSVSGRNVIQSEKQQFADLAKVFSFFTSLYDE